MGQYAQACAVQAVVCSRYAGGREWPRVSGEWYGMMNYSQNADDTSTTEDRMRWKE